MACRVVVGGQYGSEGKGKVVALYAGLEDAPWVVRCGGPNSGHTALVKNREVVLRQVPAGAGHPGALLLLSAGCVINENILIAEVDELDIPQDKIIVDPRAVLIKPSDLKAEETLIGAIGSTGSGTGAALIRRISRSQDVVLAGESNLLLHRVRIEPVAPLLHEHLDRGGSVIIEGTQGFALSLLHGAHYPHVTSRDTTAAGFVMEVGLSPRQIDAITLVIRTFPIRVGGNSGPLEDEISWSEIQRTSGAPMLYPEYTSVTNRLRRVARFDLKTVLIACKYNRPTELAVMGLDRIDYANYGVSNASDLTEEALKFIKKLEQETSVPIKWVGTGFSTRDAIDFSSSISSDMVFREALHA